MRHEDFDKLLHGVLIPEVVGKLTAKSDEYASKGDKLANFKKTASKQGRTPQQALLGMQDKHIISIQDLVNDRPEGRIRPLEMWLEKITDDMAYDCLMYALEVEAQDSPLGKTADNLIREFNEMEIPEIDPVEEVLGTLRSCNLCGNEACSMCGKVQMMACSKWQTKDELEGTCGFEKKK